MNIKKLDLLKIRNLKFRASRRQTNIDRLLRRENLEKDLWKSSIKTLIILAKIKLRCEELERISENLQQTVINGLGKG
jgi:hypothetical protein